MNFSSPGSVRAIADSDKSSDIVWFVKIENEVIAEKNLSDEYGHRILEGSKYIERKYLESEGAKKNIMVYKEMSKTVYCYLSSEVYPYVNCVQKIGCIYYITNSDFCDVMAHVQHNGLRQLWKSNLCINI